MSSNNFAGVSTTKSAPPPGRSRTTAETVVPILTERQPRYAERVAMGLLRGSALLSVVVTVGIVVSLLVPALEFFREVSVREFLTGTRWAPTFSNPGFGVVPLITGTIWTTLIGMLIAIPFGLGAAIFLSEYAGDRTRRILKPILEVLAGIPSVVYGYFALFYVAPVVLRGLFGVEVGTFSVLAAGIVLGIMIIPTVASLSEDAMSAVPQSLRHGSLALGVNRMRTTLRVVFPAAVSGITAAIVLGFSRAVGETMIVALAAGTRATMVGNPTESGQTMTGFIAQTATGESTPGTLTYNSLFAVGLALFVLTFIINVIAGIFVRRIREAY